MPADQKSSVFLSYSRRDTAFIDELVISLESHEFDVSFDREDLFPGERWEPRLRALIHEADTTIVVISQHWMASRECLREYEIAASLGRRVIPVIVEPVELSRLPEGIASVQFVFFHGEGHSFARGVADLVNALRTDIEWVRRQTRYQAQAGDWTRSGRSSALLLRGEALDEAEAWVQAPAPAHVMVLQEVADFISAAQSHVRDEQRKQNRLRSLMISLGALALAAALGAGWLFSQLREAQLALKLQEANDVIQIAAYDDSAVDETPPMESPGAMDDMRSPPPEAELAEPAPAPQPEPDRPVTREAGWVSQMNSSDKPTRLSAGAKVATAVRGDDNAAVLAALVQAIEPPGADRLSSAGRFNMLYMLNVEDDWASSPLAPRLREALLALEQSTYIGSQTGDCINSLKSKLDGGAGAGNVCGKAPVYSPDN